ncbi:hypothetical protein A2W24_01440 [Microgenomates group bacterium RBG_16_45_19]|nr:MAG: hypothetical protein A2W24_01440 [Microgenomates group bacterium RBG_16_45_19]
MKGNKVIASLLLVLFVMIGFLVIREYTKPVDVSLTAFKQLSQNWAKESVNQVNLATGAETVTLNKTGTDWRIGEYAADSQSVNDLITQLLEPEKVELIAETNARHQDLGVDEAQAVAVTLTAGEQSLTFLIGKPLAEGYYVRGAKNDSVYLINNLPVKSTQATQNDWVDKVVSRVDEAQIKKLTITQGGGAKLSLLFSGGDWFKEGSEQALDREPLAPLLNALAALTAQGLVADDTKVTAKLSRTITIETDSGTKELTFYPVDKETYAVQSNERPGKYSLSQGLYETLSLAEADLKPKPATSVTSAP